MVMFLAGKIRVKRLHLTKVDFGKVGVNSTDRAELGFSGVDLGWQSVGP